MRMRTPLQPLGIVAEKPAQTKRAHKSLSASGKASPDEFFLDAKAAAASYESTGNRITTSKPIQF